jgi:hypothetical protein
MALLFAKTRFCRTSILLWLFLTFAGQMLDPPRILSATAVTWPPGAAPPAADQKASQVEVPTLPNEEPQRSPLSEKQRRDLTKANFEKMKHDAKELADLAKALQDALAKSNENILSLDIVDKADKIEKLARKIKGNARGF